MLTHHKISGPAVFHVAPRQKVIPTITIPGRLPGNSFIHSFIPAKRSLQRVDTRGVTESPWSFPDPFLSSSWRRHCFMRNGHDCHCLAKIALRLQQLEQMQSLHPDAYRSAQTLQAQAACLAARQATALNSLSFAPLVMSMPHRLVRQKLHCDSLP
jgi:hypothetical protein